MALMRQKLADYRIFLREFRETFYSTGALLPSGAALARAVSRPFEQSPIKGRRLLEVGPGTGAVTDRLVDLLKEGDHLTMVELNERFVERLQARFDNEPRWNRVAHLVDIQAISLLDLDPATSHSPPSPAASRPAANQTAMNGDSHANGNGDSIVGDSSAAGLSDPRYDFIISGLPINNFDVPFATQLFDKLYELLRPGATLSFFEYFAIRRMKGVVSPKSQERARLKGIGKMVTQKLNADGQGSDLIMANFPPAWVHHVRPGSSAASHDEPVQNEPANTRPA